MKRTAVTLVLLLAALALTVVGAALGQPETVMAKAVRICMECVGIG